MKKNILISLLSSIAIFGFAQTEYDALRLSETGITGTARYMSMGGAFGSLGSDASALKDNPAGLGVFRSSEVSGTLNLSLYSNSPIEWIGNTTNQETISKLGFNNLSYIIASTTGNNDGLLSSNFSFTYNKLKDYNKSFLIKGNSSSGSFIDYLLNYSNGKPGSINYDNENLPWLTVLAYNGYLIDPIEGTNNFSTILENGETVMPNYSMEQSGSLGEFSFGWGGNFNSKLFVGANFNLRSLNYQLTSYYGEVFQKGGDFELKNVLAQDGIGANLKVGMIYLPTNNIRLGVSFHTPTLMTISEMSYATLKTPFIPEEETYPATTPTHSQGFNLWNPLQAQLSASYLFGKKGLLSAEYDYINYKGARFNTNSESTQLFADINNAMSNVLNDVHVLKLGAEAKITPNFALRGGYSIISPSVNKDYTDGKLLVSNSITTNTEYFNQIDNTSYASLGLGYRSAGWFADLTYSVKAHKEDFYPYQDKALSPARLNSNTKSIALTVGIKF